MGISWTIDKTTLVILVPKTLQGFPKYQQTGLLTIQCTG